MTLVVQVRKVENDMYGDTELEIEIRRETLAGTEIIAYIDVTEGVNDEPDRVKIEVKR